MSCDSHEKIIKDALNTIHTPQYNIALKVENKIKSKKPVIRFKKTIPSALVVCLFIILSVRVAVATAFSFNNLLSFISSDIALILQPIGISSEDKGIKMEVVAAMNDDEMAVVYFTMQDLIGNRIDETLDIYDYSLNGAHMFNIQVIKYDEITKTATLRMQANGGKKLNGKKVRFKVDSFLSDKIVFDAVDTNINPFDISHTKSPQTIPLDMNNIPGGGGHLYEKFKSQGTIKVLKTDEMNINLPNIDFMYISNIGYIGDYLHIQTKWVGEGIDDHGYLYFVDSLGNKININSASINFGTDEYGNTKYGHGYIEYIFDMRDINMDEVKLMGYFVSNGNYTNGNWNTTFKLESVEEEKQIASNIKFDTWNSDSIFISPIGVTIVSKDEINDPEKINVTTNMTDGTTQTFESLNSYSERGETKLKFLPSLQLDVSKVKSVVIDETVININ